MFVHERVHGSTCSDMSRNTRGSMVRTVWTYVDSVVWLHGH